MCTKHFIGFPCGHCSVPTLVKCPLVTSDPRFPICTNPAEQPHQSQTVCHPCSRVLWNNEVLKKENEHKQLHRDGKCTCEIVFQNLEDTDVAVSTPQTPQAQYSWTERVVPWTPYPPFGMDMAMGQASFEPYGPVKIYRELQYQRDEDRLAFAKQYIQKHPEQKLFYDHSGYIYLYVPDKIASPHEQGVQVPASAQDIHGRPPFPPSAGRSNFVMYDQPFGRTDFERLDVIALQLEARGYDPVTARAAYDADCASKVYGVQWDRVPSTQASGAGPYNYGGSGSGLLMTPGQTYGAPAAGFDVAGPPNYTGSSNNYTTASNASHTHRNNQILLASHSSAAPPPPPGYYTPNQGMNQTWNTTAQPYQPAFQPYNTVVEPQQPVSGYVSNRGYGGGKYRQARYGPGPRYHPEAPQPFSGAPNDFYTHPGARMTATNPSDNNIESLTQLENLNIGAGAHMQQISHRVGSRARGQRGSVGGYAKRTSQHTSQASKNGVSSLENAMPKVKLPNTANTGVENEGNAKETTSTTTKTSPTTPNTPKIETQAAESASDVVESTTADSVTISNAEKPENEENTPSTPKSTTSPVIVGSQMAQ
ncbi:hypothetical protein HYFRA_00007827 [Hymenoscyphus fraxineus]|uniref:Uncharacterized protein n=1 Tax=Hymenoscyphus fraxineus TaxID=746836 RepID=A0A9N9PEV5_9HELO|nr:hypothetical protein HYFRA_00007827 [Hymenoscyphus fraxineus]